MAGWVETVLWIALFGAAALPLRAAVSRSWATMWGAAICSLALSVAGMLTIGALVYLLTCLELGASVALRWQVPRRGWAACLLAAAFAWVIVVPAQIVGPAWLPWIAAFPLVVAGGSVALLVPPPASIAPNGRRTRQTGTTTSQKRTAC